MFKINCETVKNEWVCEWAWWGGEWESLEIVLFSQEPSRIICWQYILAEVSFHFKVNWKGKLNLIVPLLREEKGGGGGRQGGCCWSGSRSNKISAVF